MKTTGRLLALTAGLAALALVGWGLWQGSRPQPEQLQGMLEARETDVALKITGRIAEVAVQEGQRVERGALLVKVDSPEVTAKLAQATGARDAAEAVAEKAKHGARGEEIRMARAQWERAVVAQDLAAKGFQRADNLFKEGLLAAQRRDEAEANLRAAEGQTRAAKAQLDMAEAGARREDQAAAAAQARQVAGVVQEVEAARAETELHSPVGGEVAKVLAKVGELSPAGVPVVTVVDLADHWALFNVREDRLAAFAIGSEFDATVPALGSASVRFKVTGSSPLPDFATWRATRSGAGYDLRSFEVRAKPLKPLSGMRPGMSVLVTLPPLK
jgi:HlyD family secretion protein